MKCKDKSNETFILEYMMIFVALKQVCVCNITKLTHYFRALISTCINGRNKFNYYKIELISLNLAATMYMTPM